MTPEFVHGPIAPVFTAFHADGSFDPDGQRRFLDFLALSGAISSYFVRSGMGQMYTFEYDDVKAMADTACSQLAGRGAVLVGASGIWNRDPDNRPDPEVFTRQAVELSQYCEQAGAAGVVHTLPEAIAPAVGETYADVILRYFERVSAAVRIPVFIYQPPSTMPEYIVTPDLAPRLAALPNIKGMKASTADAMYILDVCWTTRDQDFAYIVGHEGAFYAGLHMGAKAVIGQGSTINPQILVAVQERFEAGDDEGAMEAQRSVNLLCQKAVNPVEFYKRYATEKGYAIGPDERPMTFNPYGGGPRRVLTQEQYDGFKALLESELAKFAPQAAGR
jgi:4-hydroxy-tetrahydrodipicolinate synthase